MDLEKEETPDVAAVDVAERSPCPNVKFEKMARQKARNSLAMRRGTTRVQCPPAPVTQPQPSTATSGKKTSLEGHLERNRERIADKTKDEQSVYSHDTSSDMHSVISKSDASECKKARPSRPRRPKKYPPPLDHASSDNMARHEGLKRNLEDASVVMQDVVVTNSPRRSPLTFGDLNNVAKRSLELSIGANAVPRMQAPTLRQKVKEQQRAQKKLVIQQLVLKEPSEPDDSKTEMEQMAPTDQRVSRYAKVSSALQRKRPVAVLKTAIPKPQEEVASDTILEVTLTVSDSVSSSNPSPVSESKQEEPVAAEPTKTGSRLAVMAAARRTKIQSSPSKHCDGALTTVDSESLTNSCARLSVFATPTRKVRSEDNPMNSSTRSLDVDKMDKGKSNKLHGMNPSPFISQASRPDPHYERNVLSASSPSVTRSAALQKLSIDPALKRFQRTNRNSTGSMSNVKREEDAPRCSSSVERSLTPSRESPCPSRVPSLQATFSSHSEETNYSNPKVAVGDVAVGDIIDVFLYRPTKKSAKEMAYGYPSKTAHSIKPVSSARLSESGKASRKSKHAGRESARVAKASFDASDSARTTQEGLSAKKIIADPFGFSTDSVFPSNGWESFA